MKLLVIMTLLFSEIIYGSANSQDYAIDLLEKSALDYENRRFAEKQNLLKKSPQQEVVHPGDLSAPQDTYTHKDQRKTLPGRYYAQDEQFFSIIESSIQESENRLRKSKKAQKEFVLLHRKNNK